MSGRNFPNDRNKRGKKIIFGVTAACKPRQRPLLTHLRSFVAHGSAGHICYLLYPLLFASLHRAWMQSLTSEGAELTCRKWWAQMLMSVLKIQPFQYFFAFFFFFMLRVGRIGPQIPNCAIYPDGCEVLTDICERLENTVQHLKNQLNSE